jgi:hypothetical protein
MTGYGLDGWGLVLGKSKVLKNVHEFWEFETVLKNEVLQIFKSREVESLWNLKSLISFPPPNKVWKYFNIGNIEEPG